MLRNRNESSYSGWLGRGTILSEETARVPSPWLRLAGRLVAHSQNLLTTWNKRLCHLLRIQGLSDQRVLRQLLSPHVRCDIRHAGKPDGRCERCRTMEGSRWWILESCRHWGRLKKVERYLEGEEAFCVTYGDGVSDIDISATIAFHRTHGKLVTVTAVQPPRALAVCPPGIGHLRIPENRKVRAADQWRFLCPLTCGAKRGPRRSNHV